LVGDAEQKHAVVNIINVPHRGKGNEKALEEVSFLLLQVQVQRKILLSPESLDGTLRWLISTALGVEVHLQLLVDIVSPRPELIDEFCGGNEEWIHHRFFNVLVPRK
jgi:hypothetical protein